MLVSYMVDDDSHRLRRINIESVCKDDFKDGFLQINIPNIIKHVKINIIGDSLYNLIVFSSKVKELLTINNGVSINIKNGPKIIENLKFGNYLMKLTIPKSVISISNYACSCCNFNEISFVESSIETINGAFMNCEFQKPFILPKSCTKISREAFKNTNFIGGFLFEKDSKLTVIDRAAFEGSTFNQRKIEFPNKLSQINEKAFFCCKNVEEIYFDKDSSLIYVGDYGFANSSINKAVFNGCSKLDFSTCCFHNAYNLESVKMPNLLTERLPSKFCYECKKLTSIELPSNLIEIGDMAFYECSLKDTLYLPNSLRKIGWSAFSKNKISSLSFKGSRLAYIGTCAFSNNKLTSIPHDIFTNIVYCGDTAFSINPFKQLKLSAPINNEGFKSNIFAECFDLEYVELYNTVADWEEIPYGMFRNCPSLKQISIPNSVKKLKAYCFYNTGFESIELDNIIDIESFVFMSCKALETCNFSKNDKLKSIGDRAFHDTPSLKSISFHPFFSETIYSGIFGDLGISEIQKILKDSNFFIEIV